MDVMILLFLCFVTSCYSVKVIPKTDLGFEDEAGSEVDRRIPMVKYNNGKLLQEKKDLGRLRQQSELGIIGGITTNITQHPYQVAINDGHVFVCAGALLNRIWVVALASCTAGAQPSDLTIRVGSDTNIYGGTVYNVTDIVVHPNFNYTTEDYDISLVKLSSYMCFDKDVAQIGFSLTAPKNSLIGTVSGWGVDGNKSASTFRQLNMRAIYNGWCQDKYTITGDVITPRMFCAVAGNSGPCFNDFGDPWVVNGLLYGLYSWSRGCADPDFPAVFTNLASVADWIHTVMNNACTCGVY